MKRLFVIALFALISYSTYYDLTIGTLPTLTTTRTSAETIPDNQADEHIEVNGKRTVEVVIEPGDTVLSVIERIHQAPVKASINQIIYDFQTLNNNIDPTEIQIGEKYFIPIYPQ